MGELRVMDPSGDMSVTWNPRVQAEVDVARETFDRMRNKGHLAYRKEGAGRGTMLREFDPSASEIIITPPLQGG